MTAGVAARPTVEKVIDRPRHTGRIISVLSASGIVVALQQTMVVPLLPDFPRILNAEPRDVGWLITITLLTGAVSTPVLSRLADMFGKRRMILVCLGATVLGSVIAALGGGLLTMIIGRGVQGFAFAQIPIGISVMRDELPKERVPAAVALMSATLGIGSAIGLVLSGAIYEHAGWHAVFWTCAVAGAVLAVLIVMVVPESSIRTRGSFDYLGAVLLCGALTCVLLAINKGALWGWRTERTMLLLIGAALLLAAWFPTEMRAGRPLVDLRTSSARPVLVTNVAALFVGFSMYANMLATTQQLQIPKASGFGFGVGVFEAGLCILPSGLAMVLLAPVSASLTKRFGAHVTLISGCLALAVGYVARVFLTAEIWQLIIGAVIASAGTALALAAMPTLIMRSVPITETASANGLNTLLRSIGTSVCSATVIAVLASNSMHVGGQTLPTLQGFKYVFWLATIAALIAAGLAATLPASLAVASAGARIGASELVVSGVVCGVVGGADSQPIRQAVVTVMGLDGAAADWSRADNDGRYSVVLPGSGDYVVVASADGWSPHSQVVSLSADASSQNLELVEQLTLSGRVSEYGRPLADALVSVTRPTGEAVAATRTDASGAYRMPLLPTGRFIVTVVTPDRRAAHSRQVLVLATQSHSIDVDLGRTDDF